MAGLELLKERESLVDGFVLSPGLEDLVAVLLSDFVGDFFPLVFNHIINIAYRCRRIYLFIN